MIKPKKFRTPELSPIFAVFDENSGNLEEWRAKIKDNWNIYYDDIIKKATYLEQSGLLERISQIDTHKPK